MKATKIVMLFALMAFVAMAYADVDPGPAKLTVKISLKTAKQNRALVSAIFQQVNPRVLLQSDQPIYAAKVRLGDVVYVIFAKYREWKQFFNMLPPNDLGAKKPKKKNCTDYPIFKSEH
jgi:hypothetical protein